MMLPPTLPSLAVESWLCAVDDAGYCFAPYAQRMALLWQEQISLVLILQSSLIVCGTGCSWCYNLLCARCGVAAVRR